MLLLALLIQAAAASGPAALAVRLAPDTALIERDPASGVGYANFDFLVTHNASAGSSLELASVVMTAHDAAGVLLLRRFCDGSGLSPCIRTVPDRTLEPGATTIVYNPFYQLPARLPLGELQYVLAFSDTAGNVVDSVATTIELVKANGGEIVQPIGADAPEITARFRDPGGNVIGLYQQPA